jgi:hypothetical protein
MGTSRRLQPEADRVFVWVMDGSGTIIGVKVDGRGEARAHAARAWLHFLRQPIGASLLHEGVVFEVKADGRHATVPMSELCAWMEQTGRPWEQGLKRDILEALARAPTGHAGDQ